MRRVTPVLPALVCLAWLTQPPRAAAQWDVTLNRPSLQGPSAQLGLIGGRFTRSSPQVLNLMPTVQNPAAPSLSMSQRPGRRGAVRQGREVAPMRLGMIASPSQGNLFRSGFLSDYDIGAISGFDTSVSPDTPLYGWPGLNMLPAPQTPLEELKPTGSVFHQFFRLARGRPASRQTPESYSSMLDAAEQRNQTRLRELYEKAFDVFAEATAEHTGGGESPTQAQKLQRLQQAARMFGAARDLTKVGQTSATEAPADLPVLDVLEAHAHLEFNRNWGDYVDQALSCLVRAARDDPDAFHRLAQARHNPGDDRPIAAYFGDYRDGHSSVLERQMLHYVRLASIDNPTVPSLMLQAYCAWVLDDGHRASQALDLAEKALRERPADQVSQGWNALIAALRYAL